MDQNFGVVEYLYRSIIGWNGFYGFSLFQGDRMKRVFIVLLSLVVYLFPFQVYV